MFSQDTNTSIFSQKKFYISNLILFLVISSMIFSEDLGRSVFRHTAFLLLILPFLKITYPPNIKYYALFGYLYSNLIVLGNFLSPYVDDWSRGLTALYYWVMILPAFVLVHYSKATINKFFVMLFLALIFALIPAISDLYTGLRRYEGFHGQPIAWGNLSILTGMLCLCYGFSYKDKKLIKYWSIPMLGFVIGIFCSLVSGSRGGWILVVSVIPFMLYKILADRTYKIKILAFLVIIICIYSVINSTSLGVIDRLEQAKLDVAGYIDGDRLAKASSLGTRFELWKTSIKAIKKHPFMGIGQYGLAKWKSQDSEYMGQAWQGHPHNFYLALGLTGVPSLIAFLAMIFFFCKETMWRIPDTSEAHLVRRLSIVLVIAYMEFSLSDSFWALKLGMSYFIFISVYLMYLQYNLRQQALTNDNQLS